MRSVWQWLKNHFIPHEGNNHQPHFLRWEATLAVLGVILFFEAVFLIQTLFVFPAHFFGAILPDVLVDLTNDRRIENTVLPLRENPLLAAAAELKAKDMAARGYFAHYAPDGTSPWRWFNEVGYRYAYAGENLAVNFTDSKDVVDAWMNSPKHRENIVSGNYTEIGIATAEGVFQERPAVFVVQLFGRPAAPLPASVGEPIAVLPPQPVPVPVTVVLPSMPAAAGVATPPLSPSVDLIEVRGADETGVPLSPASEVRPDAGSAGSTEASRRASRAAAALASPRATTNVFLIIVATVVFAALLLAFFIRIRIQYPRLLINGLLMLMLVVSLLIWNHALALMNAHIV
ncbi:MAG: CAP domain-containing protein [Patescibacteria group bacterium]